MKKLKLPKRNGKCYIWADEKNSRKDFSRNYGDPRGLQGAGG